MTVRRIPVAQILLSLLAGPRTIAAQRSPSQPTLNAVERRVASTVDRRTADALALLERVVNINSGTMNFSGVRQVGAVFRAQLDSLGFATRWVDGAPFNRAGHLVAERNGSGRGPRILLIGHLDTVFEPRSSFQKFERLTDSTARGPGVIDMKGGDVIIVEALRASGIDPDTLKPDDLAAIDEFHMGGRAATAVLADTFESGGLAGWETGPGWSVEHERANRFARQAAPTCRPSRLQARLGPRAGPA